MSRWVAIACVTMMVALFVMTRWQSGKIDELKAERDSLSEKLSAQQVINTTTLTAVATFHRISGETIDAKRKNTLDAQTAKKDVKVILVGNDCASADAPGALIDRMRQYKN
ncbi:DUF2570 family protein [Morganella morganii]|uniref:DUF2570 family protein n=1 Tax=Morganella morganii TaxID=582 RepID=UPI00131A2E05|nr:DUF2570 family protein [Morganella morganii]MBT0429336.1 DUF2570 family protein [Morganella morganii subsp. morganii]MBT0524073.1 DUF2570 family protein [Morganella morganii subsp. morganii]QWM19435.1 DUF2570 family protein [Morganella morganii subsp. morganii]HDU8619560.1 DUF2570 family protein [Morganella morganii]